MTDIYSTGIEDVRDGRYEKGIERLALFIESPESDFVRREHARMLLGYAKGQMDDWEGAIECFKTAMVKDIECLPAQTALGHSYLMANRIPEAIETFSLAVQKDPDNAQAHHGLGWALLVEGKNFEEALYQSQEALRLSPRSPAIRDTVGWALYKLGDVEAAAEQLEQAVKLDPDHPDILAHWREVRAARTAQSERKLK